MNAKPTDNLERLVRPNIRELKPYHSARQDFLSGVLLDANENSF
jgi:histidinol-phosphate aminotransferase